MPEKMLIKSAVERLSVILNRVPTIQELKIFLADRGILLMKDRGALDGYLNAIIQEVKNEMFPEK